MTAACAAASTSEFLGALATLSDVASAASVCDVGVREDVSAPRKAKNKIFRSSSVPV